LSFDLLIDLKRLFNLTLKIQNSKFIIGNDLHIKKETNQEKREDLFPFLKVIGKEEI